MSNNDVSYVKGLNIFGVKARQIPCLTGNGEPSIDLALKVGLLYINEDNGDMYKCVKGDNEELVWKLVNDNSQIATSADDEIIDMLIEEDMLLAVTDGDGAILSDENGDILIW